MPRHEFGIMQSEPIKGERFDEYEPEKYDCITIDDVFIEPLLYDVKPRINYLILEVILWVKLSTIKYH